MKQALEKALLEMKKEYQKAQIGITNDFVSAVGSLADYYIKSGAVTFIEAEEIKKRILRNNNNL